MNLTLDRPLVSIDLETTGTRVGVDRIIQVACCVLTPEGKRDTWKTLVNPGCPIPKEATEIHGITDEMVADANPLSGIAPVLFSLLHGRHLSGFNVRRFDWPFLLADLQRVGAQTPTPATVVDVMAVYHSLVKRDLPAAVRLYLGREHVCAHDAAADAEATLDVLDAMVSWHQADGLPSSPGELVSYLRDPSFIDEVGKFRWVNGEPCIAFGKHAGTPLPRLDPGFLRWMLGQDFDADSKRIAQDALAGRFPERAS